MCGIAGKIDRRQAVDPALIERMCESIEHRGPDSRGVYLDGGVGLGVQRLAVIDLEHGDQPIYTEDRATVLVLNGEIYNYVELREELLARGHQFRTASDTEMIIHLYEELGPRCVEQLRGMFAFAIWDGARRRLMLAPRPRRQEAAVLSRDRLDAVVRLRTTGDPARSRGPARARHDRARQLPALSVRAPPAIRLRGDQQAAARPRPDLGGWRPGAQPLLVAQLRPARRRHDRRRLARSSASNCSRRPGCDCAPTCRSVPSCPAASTRARSSRRWHARPRRAYGRSRSASTWPSSTRPLTPGRSPSATTPSITSSGWPRTRSSVLPRLVWHYGEPFADSSALPSFYLAELTRRHVTVALNGDGGDESFAGYTRYLALASSRRGAPSGDAPAGVRGHGTRTRSRR